MQTRTINEIAPLIKAVKKQIATLGDMRPGHLSIQYRKSGKMERGYNQLSYTFKGRSHTEYIQDDDLQRVRKEVAAFRCFKELCDSLTELSVELSKARTAARIESEEE